MSADPTQNQLDPGARFRANPDFKLRQIAGENILVPTGESALRFNGLVSLNETGYILWTRLSGGCTRQELCQALEAEYDAASDQILCDVDLFLSRALEKGLVAAE